MVGFRVGNKQRQAGCLFPCPLVLLAIHRLFSFFKRGGRWRWMHHGLFNNPNRLQMSTLHWQANPLFLLCSVQKRKPCTHAHFSQPLPSELCPTSFLLIQKPDFIEPAKGLIPSPKIQPRTKLDCTEVAVTFYQQEYPVKLLATCCRGSREKF